MLRALTHIDDLPWQLHLIGSGSGPEKEECLRRAQRMGKQTIIYGALSQPELATIMQGAHLFVLPSFFEGLPLVLLEALACGCRLIATSLPGVTEVLGGLESDYVRLVETPRFHGVDQPIEEDEALFEENLSAAIREQISEIIGGPEIYYRQIKDQIAAFSWGKVFEKIEQVYYQVIADHSSDLK